MTLLSVRGLTVEFASGVRAVDGLDLDVEAGRVLGVVGESGSGKSVTSLAVLGLLRDARVSGAIEFAGQDLLSLPPRALRALRGDRMAMVFQDPLSCLNPYYPVAFQIAEAYRAHRRASRRAAHALAVRMLERVGIPEAERRARSYPHEFSGGMRQRVMIAMALCLEPDLLVADEPTTALDVTVQAQVLDLLRDLRERSGTAIMLITHDMGVVAGLADDVVVMHGGRRVEAGPVREVFHSPATAYTRGLLECVPRVDGPLPHRLPTVEVP
ncbi:ABC transporter ATP-binding protein [Saccharothrix variisporea]|uniref:Peptide/nickel transport system ATP-binding protein n=1 Tax=Saccharothrix variisporea TaxID=543527 RepID=A0A495X140_9PSEU|nr:ABC transporter ATP-binding protein [Saccharothrix variisporea]RKT67682.1 peptide/nickel transport system ATP-binding protein [Saccharothrix variisporea]